MSTNTSRIQYGDTLSL
ncbi:hypothetical protein I306_06237 [Cryptococcus gattii EJB2]|uniref:Uncharacterized protein n=1 Tax=Cryptococcus gattii EJB2 TaxID=1296103 RepID=A0ABR5BN77_9TREE|nr:hypothetical protein I306_06237 [Cryptococcus gattii EJB2]